MRIECVPRESFRRVSHAPLKGRLIESPRKLPWRQKEVIRARNFSETSQTWRKFSIKLNDRLKTIGSRPPPRTQVTVLLQKSNDTRDAKGEGVASAREL